MGIEEKPERAAHTRALHTIISMTANGDPLENAIAERVNGIIKQEYLEHYVLNDKDEVMKLLATTVNVYNKQRSHMSCDMLTPEIVHQNAIEVQRNWKSYYKSKNVEL